MQHEPRVGDRFGPYELKEQLGQGGMGTVYRAFDVEHRRSVALKLLVPGLAADPVFRERFMREGHIAAGLTEPHVLPIHRFGDIDGILYIDMRLAEGYRSLSDVLAQQPMDPAVAVAVVNQIAAALDAAHESDLVHRDVKPANILVGPRNFAYLIDFGIAMAADDERLTETGLVMGSRPYMAPERFTAGYRDRPAADIYALGCVLHKALAGTPPIAPSPGPGPVRVAESIPPGMATVIRSALDPDPTRRPPSAGQFAAEAVDRLTAHERETVQQIVDKPDESRQTASSTHPITRSTTRRVSGDSPHGDDIPARPNSKTRRPALWGAAVLVVAVALVVGYLVGPARSHGTRKAANGPSSFVTQDDAPATDGNEQPTNNGDQTGQSTASGVGTLADGSCVNADRQTAPCSQSGTGLAKPDTTCTSDSVRSDLGYDALLSPMLRLQKFGGFCLIYPAAAAAQAGAGAVQVRELASKPASTLLACTASASGSGSQIPCSSAHRLEYVGGWMTPPDDLRVDAVCAVPAQTYSGRTFDGTDQSVTVQLLQTSGDAGKKVRCAIASRHTTTGSLWQRGTDAQ